MTEWKRNSRLICEYSVRDFQNQLDKFNNDNYFLIG